MEWTQEHRNRLKQVRLFVLDMDGTIYLGDRLFPFTKGFLQRGEGDWQGFLLFHQQQLQKTGRLIWKSFPAWASPSRRKKCSSPTG